MNRPIGEVFRYIGDLENYPSWFPGIAQMRAVDESKTRYDEIAHLPGGKEEAITVERVAFDPPHHVAIHAGLEPALPRFDYRFEELDDERTRFTWICSRRGRGAKAALMQRLMPLVLGPRLKGAFENLKRILEHEADEIMRAGVTRRFGPAREVTAIEPHYPRPSPGKGEVIVRQAFSSINHIDVARGAGYGRKLFALRGIKGFPMVLGEDVCGVVSGVGSGVRDFKVGDSVFGVKPPSTSGAFADYVAVGADHLRRAPAGVSNDQLGAAPYVFLTAWTALVKHGGLTAENAPGKRIFIQGGAGAVGSMALQIARNWGAEVAVSCHGDDVDYALGLGADAAFDFAKEDYAHKLSDVDIALCCADPAEAGKMLSILRRDAGAVYATVVHPTLALGDELGAVKGILRAKKLQKEAGRLAAKDGRKVAWVLFEPSGEGLNQLTTWLGEDRIRSRIETTLPLEELAQAHAAQAKGPSGKIVVAINSQTSGAHACKEAVAGRIQ